MRLNFTGVKFFKVMNIKLINLPSERAQFYNETEHRQGDEI